MTARRLLAILALGGALAVSRTAQADPLPLELTWEVPAGCPDDAAVVARIERILVAPAPPGVTVIANGRVRATENHRFELTLTLRAGDVEETRNVEASSCSALADASAVVIALAMDPSHATAPEIAPIAPPPPPPRPPPPAPPSLPPPPHAKPIALDLGGTLEPTILPEVGGGLELAALVRVHRLRFGIRGALWLWQHPLFDEGAGAGASFGMFQVGAFGAYVFPVYRALLVGPALGLDADIVRVRGFGIRDPQTSWTAWPTVALGVRGEMQLRPCLGLFARADLLVPIDPPPFVLGTAAVPLHDVPSVAPRFAAGIELLLP